MARRPVTMTTATAAERLGCTIRWVCYLIADGTLRAERDDRRCWRIEVSSVTDHARARTARAKHRRRTDAGTDSDATQRRARGAHRKTR